MKWNRWWLSNDDRRASVEGHYKCTWYWNYGAQDFSQTARASQIYLFHPFEFDAKRPKEKRERKKHQEENNKSS